jgi:hypothetical protein
MALEVTKLMANPDAQVIIHVYRGAGIGSKTSGVKSDPIIGFVSKDISLGSSADWQSPMDTVGGALKTFQSLINLAGAAVGSAMDYFGMGGISQKSLRAYATTVVDYMGTNKPTFTLPLIFPAIKSSDDPREKVLRLLECVYPSGEGWGSETLMEAPLNYTRLLTQPQSGYVDVQIGQWLRLHWLVISNVDTTFSKEVTRDRGVPLYAEATVAFTFIKTPNIREVRSWFSSERVR